jgi:hypothetical protein
MGLGWVEIGLSRCAFRRAPTVSHSDGKGLEALSIKNGKLMERHVPRVLRPSSTVI